MKVIHIPYCFYPEQMGGTEVYVKNLIFELKKRKVKSIVIAPSNREKVYKLNSIRIYHINTKNKIQDIKEIYGEGNENINREILKIIEKERPKIVHIHSFSRAVSYKLVRDLREKNIKIVFTYHTPAISCLNGYLLFLKKFVCDGKIRPLKCAYCKINSLGINSFFSLFLLQLSLIYYYLPFKIRKNSKIFTILNIYQLTILFKENLKKFLNNVDIVIALSKWSEEVIKMLGVDRKKIVLSYHGIKYKNIEHKTKIKDERDKLKFIMIGRLDPEKGFDTIIKAVKKINLYNFEIHIYGICQENNRYIEKLKKLIDKDTRIFLKEYLQPEEIMGKLEEYNALIVPSKLMETGPLVVLESFAANVPVIGSNIGGIHEKIKENIDGILVKDFNSVNEWKKILERILLDKSILESLKENIKKPKNIRDVSNEIIQIYASLINEGEKVIKKL